MVKEVDIFMNFLSGFKFRKLNRYSIFENTEMRQGSHNWAGSLETQRRTSQTPKQPRKYAKWPFESTIVPLQYLSKAMCINCGQMFGRAREIKVY